MLDPLEKEIDEIRKNVDFDELLSLAKAAIIFFMKERLYLPVEPKGFYAATFVTLTRFGQLRGCIGSLKPYRDIREDVVSNAVGAAFQDPRFPPLGENEFEGLELEVSVLTDLVPFSGSNDDFKKYIDEEKPGVVIERGMFRATFLPDVWHELPNVNEFLEHLSMKAGMPPNGWMMSNKYVYKTLIKKKPWHEIDEKPFLKNL